MAISHTQEFGIYHWDTFDNETLLVDEAPTLEQAIEVVIARYKDRIRSTGADRVEIVDRQGNIRLAYSVS